LVFYFIEEIRLKLLNGGSLVHGDLDESLGMVLLASGGGGCLRLHGEVCLSCAKRAMEKYVMMGIGSGCRKCNEESEVLEGRYVTLSSRMILEQLKSFSKDRPAGAFYTVSYKFLL